MTLVLQLVAAITDDMLDDIEAGQFAELAPSRRDRAERMIREFVWEHPELHQELIHALEAHRDRVHMIQGRLS